MPTPNLYAETDRPPFAPEELLNRSTRVELLYVTDRAPGLDDRDRLSYGHERSRSLAFGSAVVEIGRGGDWDALERDSARRERSRAWRLSMGDVRELGRLPPTPAPPQVEDAGSSLGVRPRTVAEQDLVSELERRLAKASKRELLIYVHGYNIQFDDAAFDLAELWHFSGREVVPVLYTWPAGSGGVLGYARDRESGEFTIFHLKQFLRLLGDISDLEGIHLLAHSRGTDVLLSAVRELAIETRARGIDPRAAYPVRNLILAAPDMDVDVLGQRVIAEQLGSSVDQLTVYSSREDKAIALAEKLFGSALRVGRIRVGVIPAEIDKLIAPAGNLAIIENRVRAGLIGHGYFHSNPAASSDLILVIRDQRRPGRGHGRPLQPAGVNLWVLEDGYPAD